MQFEVIYDDATYNLNDYAPFRMAEIRNLGPANVVRLSQRAPLQHGITDLGFRVQPTVISLVIRFTAATDALLDTYRQALTGIFRPAPDIPLTLRVTRDDSTIRSVECYTTGEVSIDLLPEHRAARMHEAIVLLRAHDPAWISSTPTLATFSGTSYDWWTAGGLIGTANVMEHTEWPGQAQAWSYNGTITGDWTVAFRSAPEVSGGSKTAYRLGTTSAANDVKIWAPIDGFAYGLSASDAEMPAGSQNYMDTKNFFGIDQRITYYGGTTQWITEALVDRDLSASPRAWRGAPGSAANTLWTNPMPKVAVYNVALSEAQRIALDAHMTGTAIMGTVTIVNGGDFAEYPYVTIRGPIINPILTNLVTNDAINLVGLQLGSAEMCIVDLTTGSKRIVDANGHSVMGSIAAAPVSIAGWHLAPAPIATGGTNQIRVQAGSTSTTTQIQFLHTDHYMSF